MGCYTAMLPGSDSKVDVMWYAKSMSSVGKPQPELVHMLQAIDRTDLLESRSIRKLSWADFCAAYGVATVDVVQVDCEGKDCAILRGLLEHCVQHPKSYPRVVQFELNHLTPQCEAEALLHALHTCGYVVRSQTRENVVVERGWSFAKDFRGV